MDSLWDSVKLFALQTGKNLVLGLLVLGVGLKLCSILSGRQKKQHLVKMDPEAQSFLHSFLSIALKAVVIIIAVNIMGVPMASSVTLLGSCGLAIGLALQGSLSNFAGGIMLLLFHPFRVGDYIVSGDTEGTVEAMSVFYTTLTTFDNSTVVIPNATLSNSVLKNLSLKEKRRLSDDTIRHFGLGYSSKVPDDLYRYMRSKGYHDDILKETGLFFIDERGARDKFWNRVMFPILDVNNRVIGFGGRVMGDGEPKYLNSPETKIFDTSRNLYGLNFARTSRAKYMLVCEGYVDVIAMHQAGFTNAVASLGTAFTSQHAMLLKRYTDQVILTYDSDGAGVKAALRAIPILKEVGMSIKVLNMKPYKDPDEFIKNLGKEEFQKRIDNAVGSFMVEISVIRNQYNMQDPESKTGFYNAVAKKLLEFPEKLERDNYTEAVAREYMIPEADLKNLVNSMGGLIGVTTRERVYDKERIRQKRAKEDGIRKSQRLLLTWLIERPELFEKIGGIITPEDFDDELYREAASMVFEEYEKTGSVNPAQILNHFIEGEEQYREVAALFHATLSESLNNEEQRRAFSETVKKIMKHSLDVKGKTADIRELQEIIRQQSELAALNITLD